MCIDGRNDRYGVEVNGLNEVIDLLEEKAQTEELIKQKQKKYDSYKQWLDEYKQAEQDFGNVNPENWNVSAYDISGNATYYRPKGMSNLEADQQNANITADQYNKLKELNEAGKEWLDNGVLKEGVEEEFEEAIKAAEEGLENINNTIETELTPDIQLEIELQEKSKLVDDIQSVYDTLKDAVSQFNEDGYLSVDSLQSILELEPKYLTLLSDENGTLNVNKESLHQVAIARLYDMKVKQQNAILTEAENLANEGSIDALNEQVTVLYETAEAETAVSEARLASIRTALENRKANGELAADFDVTEYMNGIRNQLDAVDLATNSAILNIDKAISDSEDDVEQKAVDEIQKKMEYWENRIGANQAKFEQIQNEIDLFEKQGKVAGKEYYQEQMNLENERLELLNQQKAELTELLKSGTLTEGSEEWFRKKPVYWETNKCNPLNCWNSLRVLYTTTQG